MQVIAKSDMTTGNSVYASYVLRSNDLVFVFSAPYGGGEEQTAEDIDKRRANICDLICIGPASSFVRTHTHLCVHSCVRAQR